MSAQPKAKRDKTMVEKQELSVRKKELVAKEEKTIPGRYYVPYADIYETDEALAVVMEMPASRRRTSMSRWKTTCSVSTGRSISASTRRWSRSIRSTTSATTRGPSRCRTR